MLDHFGFPKAGCLSSSRLSSSKVNRADDEVDELDANERNDDPAEPIDEKITPQNACRPDGPVSHPAKRQGDQRDDDQRVENNRRQNSALRRREMHDIEALQLGIED